MNVRTRSRRPISPVLLVACVAAFVLSGLYSGAEGRGPSPTQARKSIWYVDSTVAGPGQVRLVEVRAVSGQAGRVQVGK